MGPQLRSFFFVLQKIVEASCEYEHTSEPYRPEVVEAQQVGLPKGRHTQQSSDFWSDVL